MTKHTPAPWSTRWVMRGENRLQVAIEFTQEISTEEVDANLSLIAAAPDLLEALIEMIELCTFIAPDISSNIIDNAHAAIAKATQ